MKTRVISGLVMIPLLVFIYLGGYPLFIACFILSLMALKEFFGAFKVKGMDPGTSPRMTDGANVIPGAVPESIDADLTTRGPSYVVGVFATVLLYAFYIIFMNSMYLIFWLFLLTAICLIMLFPKDRHSLSDVFVTLGGTIYISFFMIHAPLIASTFYMGESTSNWIQGFSSPVWLVILTAFGSDIFAYFTGTLIGKHKLCPNLSPKKTVEGLIGGAVGSTLLCGVYGYFFLNAMFIHCLIIGFLGGFVATIGDLSASAMKRHLGVKDYGHLIPGHGGILDRFDSVLFTAPFVFYYFQIHGLITTIIVSGYAYG